MINQRMGTKDWAMLLLLSFLWGGSFFLIGVVVAELPPLTIVTLRVGVAALTLWAVLLIGGYEIPKSFKLWRAFFMLGLLNNVIPFALIVWGQNHIGAGLASIINATTPLFTILIAGAFLADEHMSPQKVVGVVVGLFGVAVLIGGEPLADIGLDMSLQTLAQLAIMGAAISYGCASVFGRRFKALGISPFSTAVGQVTAATIILLPVTFLVERPDQLANPSLQSMAGYSMSWRVLYRPRLYSILQNSVVIWCHQRCVGDFFSAHHRKLFGLANTERTAPQQILCWDGLYRPRPRRHRRATLEKT